MSPSKSQVIRTVQVNPMAAAALRFVGIFINDGPNPLGIFKQHSNMAKKPPKAMEWKKQTFQPIPKPGLAAAWFGLKNIVNAPTWFGKDGWVDNSVPGKIMCRTTSLSRKTVLVSVVGHESDFKIRVSVDGQDQNLDDIAYVNSDDNVRKLIDSGVAFAFIEVPGDGEHEIIAEILKPDGSNWGYGGARDVLWRVAIE